MQCSPILIPFLLVFLLSFGACSPDRSAQNWVRKTERHLAKLKKEQPEWLETLDSAALQSQLHFLTRNQQSAKDWLTKPLNSVIKENVSNLSKRLKSNQIRLELQQHDPSVYNLGLRLRTLYGHDHYLETADLETLEKYLDEAPLYYHYARQKLVSPETSRCDTAVRQHIAGLTFLNGSLKRQLGNDQIPTERIKILHRKINHACFYMKDYLAWCRSLAFEANNRK